MTDHNMRDDLGPVEHFKPSLKVEPEGPQPLSRERTPALPYPIEALGPVLGAAAEAIQDMTLSPPALCGQGVLAAATLAVQPLANVQLPISGKPVPLSCYFVTIGESGERKSGVDRHALAAVEERGRELENEHDERLPGYLNDRDAWEAQKRTILADKNLKTRTDKRAALEALGPEPEPPLEGLLTCEEPTLEGLYVAFPANGPSLGIFSGEGGQFVGGHGLSPDRKLGTAAGLSALWDGATVKRIRATDKRRVFRGRRVSVHLMVQGSVALRLFGDDELRGQGFLARFLAIEPGSTMGTRFHRDAAPDSHAALSRYKARMRDLLRRPLPLAEGKRNELEPPALALTPGAVAVWRVFADHVEGQLGPDGALRAISGLANKAAEHAARMAGVLTLFDDPDAAEIDDGHMTAGVALANHYIGEALRLYEAGTEDVELETARAVLGFMRAEIERTGRNAIPLRTIYQSGPNKVRTKAAAKAALGILEGHGHAASIGGVNHRWQETSRSVAGDRGIAMAEYQPFDAFAFLKELREGRADRGCSPATPATTAALSAECSRSASVAGTDPRPTQSSPCTALAPAPAPGAPAAAPTAAPSVTGQSPDSCTKGDVADAYAEREAIAVFNGGLSEVRAHAMAQQETADMVATATGEAPGPWCDGVNRLVRMIPPKAFRALPSGMARWRQLQGDAARLWDEWSAQAHAAGWDALDLFGAHPAAPLARMDCMGLALLLNGATVVELTGGAATIEMATGARQRYRRQNRPERVPLWKLEMGKPADE